MTDTNEPTYRAAVLGCIFCGSSLSPITWKGKDDLGPLYAEPTYPTHGPSHGYMSLASAGIKRKLLTTFKRNSSAMRWPRRTQND